MNVLNRSRQSVVFAAGASHDAARARGAARHRLEVRGERQEVAPIAVVPRAVDEERRGPVHTAPVPTHEIVPDVGLARARVEVGPNAARVGAHGDGVPHEVRVVECPVGVALALEERVVHRPVRVAPGLRRHTLGGLRGVERVGVHVREREVPKDEAHLRPEARPHRLHDRVRAGAVGTLVVAVLDEGHGCVGWADAMVAVVNRRPQRPRLVGDHVGTCDGAGEATCGGVASVALSASTVPSTAGAVADGRGVAASRKPPAVDDDERALHRLVQPPVDVVPSTDPAFRLHVDQPAAVHRV
ncbi:MAG: hypothetical protein AVDCRST_MAG11-120 [uncultured Gemmatimonadaceae bacterium]|uniref:Uncharacterized protein n=1 Tax=uncultured Gemmatimonadaceae bacterium TaxID=246130 RepID=A0A6J4JYR7_9BACT|nr:MAG: hypothetical protein AVDCRST_MAG11-120 [uncultured Gemmatimonadaceae bacterium]